MNRVILIGRLTRDPEVRTTQTGSMNARFTIAVNRNYQGQNGERTADFISCVAWNKRAELVSKYCKKGMQIAIEGSIQTGSYDAQDGTKRYTTDVVCDNITFLGSRSDNQSSDNSYGGYSNYNQNNSVETSDITEDPFKDFGQEVTLTDDDLPF